MTHGSFRDQPLTGRLIQLDHRARREGAEARACLGEDARATKRARELSAAALLDGSVGASHLQRIPKLKERAVFIEPAEQSTRVIPQVVGWNVPDMALTGTGEDAGSPGRERIDQGQEGGVVTSTPKGRALVRHSDRHRCPSLRLSAYVVRSRPISG